MGRPAHASVAPTGCSPSQGGTALLSKLVLWGGWDCHSLVCPLALRMP